MVLFLYGNSTFLSAERLEEVKIQFINKNKSNINSIVFDFDGRCSYEDVYVAIRSEGLFFSKKIIIVKNFIKSAIKEDQEKLLKYLSENNISEDMLIIFWEQGDVPKNNRLIKFFNDKFKTEKFDNLSGINLSNWIKAKAKEAGIEFEEKALTEFVSFVGDDLILVKNEIEKLANFSKDNFIREKDIELLVKSKIESNIFQTVEALSSGNRNRALKLFYEQIESGSDPFYVLSMYIYQFRNLIKVGGFYSDNILDKNIIAKETKLHPFVVQKSLSQLRGFSLSGLKKIYKELELIDIGAKSGKMDIERGIERLIIGK